MIPTLFIPSTPADPRWAGTWAAYGARQALEMMGLSYVVAEGDDRSDDAVVLAPAHNALYLRCRPDDPPSKRQILPLMGVQMQAECPSEGLYDPLPVIGRAHGVTEGELHGRLTAITGGREQGPLYAVQRGEGDSMRIVFNAPVFETLGLYLSRYSWADNPGYQGFVRYVDLFWEALPERWRLRPVVAEYLRFLRRILLACYETLDLPMATRWVHPCVDGHVKHHGLVATHDVDSVYAEPRFRSGEGQSDNEHFNFGRWKRLESSLGIKAAFYLFSPDPQHSYWTRTGYTIDDPVVREAALDLADGGWEIGPHELGHRSFEEIAAEIAHFEAVTGRAPSGTRNHVLTNVPSSLKYKAQAGLLYDTTWYAEQTETSFLCGAVIPFAPMDADTGDDLALWEFPFVVEDGIVHGVYGSSEQRTAEEAIEDGRRGLDHILAHHGYACFNWHQRTFARESIYRGRPANWVTALEKLVEYFQEASGRWWNPLPAELADFWTRRAAVSVEVSADTVRVTNTGSEDFPGLVVALQNVQNPPPGAQKLSEADGDVFLLNVPVGSGETNRIICDGG
jgi:hypothetical protein